MSSQEEFIMQWGSFRLFSLHENVFWIDGGAMYGVVPRVIWEKLSRPDERNRVALRANLLLIRNRQHNILVETGLGNDIPERWKEIYGLREPSHLLEELNRAGLAPEDIDVVIPTHLHFDHSGGSVHRNGASFRATFPRAQHVIQRREWEVAMNPDMRSRVSYRREMLTPLMDEGLIRLADGDEEIYSGIWVQLTGGHSAGHQVVTVTSPQGTAVYTGDLIPTVHHLKTTYVPSLDVFPLETMRQKDRLIEGAIEGRWLVFFGHDPEIDAGYLSRDEKGQVVVEPVDVKT
jgi:glyoxylase-like metal-dependent hydrolase (beta-lactamase superfamily II)